MATACPAFSYSATLRTALAQGVTDTAALES